MSDNVTNFPRRATNRQRLDMRKGIIRCEVSARWIQFPEKSDRFKNSELIQLNVMTLDSNQKDKKLCELVLDKGQLLNMLIELPYNDHAKT